MYTLITGASSGIGYELACVFARNNHNLILVARSTDKLNALRIEIEKHYKVVAEVIPVDLSKTDSAETLFNEVKKRNLKIDILVNNAGFGDHDYFINSDINKIEEMILLNILTLTKLTKLFLPQMILSQSGKILNVASTAAFQPGPLMSVYYATKAYVLSFSEGLYEELKGTGVSTTALCPGPTESGFQKVAQMSDVPILNAMRIPTSKEVAEYGYDALMKNQAVAIHGVLNNVLARSTGFVPRSVIRKMMMKLQAKRI